MTNIKHNIIKSIIHIILIIWAVGCLYPFIWVLINSFKNKEQILINSFSLPFRNFTLANYHSAIFGRYNILKSYLNSFIVSGSVVILVLLITTFSAFALARYEFKGKKAIYSILIACMMFPIFSTIFPLYKM